MGLFARLQFDGGKAVSGMRSASGAFKGLAVSARGAQQATAGVKQAMGSLTIASAAIAGVLGIGLKKAASFESQMATVNGLIKLNAKISGQSAESAEKDFQDLSNLAKKLGASTRYSATQAAEGIEIMSKAGFGVQDVIAGLPGILNTAAAENMNLADATDIVSGVLRQFRWDTGKAGKIADILAAASAATSTDMRDLGEAFRYGGLQAANLGLSVQETAALFGIFSNSTLKASVGGTSLMNMLLGFVKGVKGKGGAAETLKKWGVQVKDQQGNLRNIGLIFRDLAEVINKTSGNLTKASELETVFGVRGVKGVMALINAQGEAKDAFGKTANAVALLSERLDVDGAAAILAESKLDSLSGQLIILGSALEGFAIEAMEPFLKGMTGGVKGFAASIGDAASALRFLNTDSSQRSEDLLKTWDALPESTKEFAQGVMEGITGIKEGFASLKQTFSGVLDMFGVGGSPREAAKLMTQVIGLAPAILGLAAALKVLSLGFGVAAGGVKTLVGATKMGVGVGRAGYGAGKGIFGALARFGAGRIPGGALAAAGVEAAMAQGTPVYVTNFQELAAMGIGGGPLSSKLGGAAAPAGATALGAASSKAAAAAGLGLGSKAAMAAGPLAILTGGLALFGNAVYQSINSIGDFEALVAKSPLRGMYEQEKKAQEAREEALRQRARADAAKRQEEFGGKMSFETLAIAKRMGGKYLERARTGLLGQAEQLAAQGDVSKSTRILRELDMPFQVKQGEQGPSIAMTAQARGRLEQLRKTKTMTSQERGEYEQLKEMQAQLHMIGIALASRGAAAEPLEATATLQVNVQMEAEPVARALQKAKMRFDKSRGVVHEPETQRTMEYTGFEPAPIEASVP